MIKGISFLRPTGSRAAYERLAGFFSALGFASGEGWDEGDSRGAAFLAPLGNLEFVDGRFPSTADLLVEVTSLDAVHQAAAAWLRAQGGELGEEMLLTVLGQEVIEGEGIDHGGGSRGGRDGGPAAVPSRSRRRGYARLPLSSNAAGGCGVVGGLAAVRHAALHAQDGLAGRLRERQPAPR